MLVRERIVLTIDLARGSLFDFDSEFSVIAFQPFIIQLYAVIYLRYYEGRVAVVSVVGGCINRKM